MHLSGDSKWREGYVSGSVYYNNQELINLLKEVFGKSSYTNPLHPDVFPGTCKMEGEVIRMTANLFHGNSNSCGTVGFNVLCYLQKFSIMSLTNGSLTNITACIFSHYNLLRHGFLDSSHVFLAPFLL